jgi:hypothetical protein
MKPEEDGISYPISAKRQGVSMPSTAEYDKQS